MDFESYISSDIVQFVIGSGEEAKTYYLNKNFIAKQSITLEALLSNGMRETVERKVHFKDVEPATFVHFADFAVTGNYTFPQSSLSIKPCIDTASDNISGNATSTTIGSEPQDSVANKKAERNPKELRETTGQKLLHHAKVYVFADTYDVKPLEERAFLSISNLLNKFLIESACNIVELANVVRYIYSNTLDDPKERVRALLSQFCARNIRELIPYEEFAKLQAEGGSFVVELMNRVVQIQRNFSMMQAGKEQMVVELCRGRKISDKYFH